MQSSSGQKSLDRYKIKGPGSLAGAYGRSCNIGDSNEGHVSMLLGNSDKRKAEWTAILLQCVWPCCARWHTGKREVWIGLHGTGAGVADNARVFVPRIRLGVRGRLFRCGVCHGGSTRWVRGGSTISVTRLHALAHGFVGPADGCRKHMDQRRHRADARRPCPSTITG
jgi:hypothetical protein